MLRDLRLRERDSFHAELRAFVRCRPGGTVRAHPHTYGRDQFHISGPGATSRNSSHL